MTQPAQYISGRTVQEQMDQLIGYVDTRAAEVATDAIASDVAQVHQDMLDADADASAAAASAAAAAGTLANAVKKTGEASQSIAGDISISGKLDVTGDIAGNNASLIGTVEVPTEATGTASLKAANSTKVKNELDNYAPMVRTTGIVARSGELIQSAGANGNCFTVRATNINYSGGAPASNTNSPILRFVDANDTWIAFLFARHKTDNTTDFNLWVRNSDGTTKTILLGSGNVI